MPTATPTSVPVESITAPREVWECFLARDDGMKDKYDIVLSSCGWRESVIEAVYITPFYQKGWDRHVVIDSVGGHHAQEAQVNLLAKALSELSLLLRIEFYLMKKPVAYDPDYLYVRFQDVEELECGRDDTDDFWGCAHPNSTPQEVEIAVRNKSNEELYSIIVHELLHVLALMGHAEQGVMSYGDTYGLSDMDRAQLWLFSDPRIPGGTNAPTLEAIEQAAHIGEWVAPPELQSSMCTYEEKPEWFQLGCSP